MVSRSLEKMILIAIGLSTVVIVGVPVLMYAIDMVSTTSHLQEVQFSAEQIFNATRDIDNGVTNTTVIGVWINPGFSVTAEEHSLVISYNPNGVPQRTWSETYNHVISIDQPISATDDRLLFTMEIVQVDNVIHISFIEPPVV